MGVTIQFLGGVGTVTGSKYLVEHDGKRVLVDCGLFQGVKELRLRNWAPFPIDPKSIDAVVLTHAHLDHTGYLPLLVRNGFRGPIFASAPTRDLAKIILVDSAQLQEEDALEANRLGYTRHEPARPLYSVADAHAAMSLFLPIAPEDWAEILPAWRIRLRPSGHILGSTFIELEVGGQGGGKKIVFSGDLGRRKPIVLNPRVTIEQADALLIESTYGDRIHPAEDPLDRLEAVVKGALERQGHLLIPSFAVGRTQDVLFLLSVLRRKKRIPDVPIYLDSPMGIHASDIYADHPRWHRLSADEVREIHSTVTWVKSHQQSGELLSQRRSAIVVAGSGMLSGGRILNHLAERLPNDRNTVLIVGFQAPGTRGRLLAEGARELKIHGGYVPVRARIEHLSGLSAHADQAETLEWLAGFVSPPKLTFIVHGEPQAADALRVRIKDKLGWNTRIPAYLERIEL